MQTHARMHKGTVMPLMSPPQLAPRPSVMMCDTLCMGGWLNTPTEQSMIGLSSMHAILQLYS